MRKLATRLAVLALFAVVVGCAITDYTGIQERRTTAEAKMWGKEVAWSGVTPPGYDGTYSYTVSYDNHGGVVNTTINSYMNPVVGSFKRDGLVDVDGDDVQGSGGELGGKFLPFFIARDNAFDCQFFDNITFDKSPVGAGVALCFDGPTDIVEEIDKDWDIHAAFTDLDQFFKSIWNGQTPSPFNLDISAVRINGSTYFHQPFSISVVHTGNRPRNFTIFNGAGLQAAIQQVLDHTQNGVPVNFGFVTSGGMTIDMPSGLNTAFNHTVLRQMAPPSSGSTGGSRFNPKIF